MHSRAYLLLQKEYRQFRESELQGIIAVPLYENMMDWDVQMNGLLGTPWQGLFFRLTMNFTLEYNFVPPVVKFTIVPFHPNVHQTTGKPCIDFLDDLTKWKEGYTFSSILLTIQVMLSEPVLDNPVNLEAAQMLMLNRSMYMLINHKIFKEAVLSAKKKGKLDLTKLQFVPPKFTRKVSFNDYYMTWCRIATSKVDDHDRASLFEDPNFIGMYYKWKTAERNHPKEWNLK
ncbi:ubiquitin-conjugating enzyme E2 U [Suncus etruscus]|uniref:ubiquitin-conjugating enzyme E2 U n=1 Tax=Suncus etruscus TaxID=109475 RepID=UPI002110DE9E|nr:ubiquitin-conjugating enzyme E2 U [Suncus etruscus]